MDFDEISRSLASYAGHLQHGHTWKLKAKVYGNFVLTKLPCKTKIGIQWELQGKSKEEICVLLQIHAFRAMSIEKAFRIVYYKIR